MKALLSSQEPEGGPQEGTVPQRWPTWLQENKVSWFLR